MSAKIIQTINHSAVHMCAGNMEQAKHAFDSVLEQLELKVQTTELDSKHLLPSYLVNLLIHFYVKTSKQIIKINDCV